jgi:hypothetical protein
MEFGMTSIHRPLLAMLCAVAFMIGASPARSTVFTATAPLSSPPVTVTSSNPLPVAFDFGQSFASISFVQFQLTFSGDLWDPDELWFISSVGGQVNLGGISQSGAKLNISPSNTAFYTDLLDGTFSDNLTAQDWFTTSSFGLANIAIEIDAIPLAVAEPASLVLLAGGLAGLARVRRRGTAGASPPLAAKQIPCAA